MVTYPKWGFILLSFLLLIFLSGQTQSFTPEEWQQAYARQGDSTYFLFFWGGKKAPERVVVTGSFRNWSEDMNDRTWRLSSTDGQYWVLGLADPGNQLIPPRANFKFRIDKGVWIDPAPNAPNTAGGNYIFMPEAEARRLQVEIRSDHALWVRLEGLPRSLDPGYFRLTNFQGQEIPIAEVMPNTAKEVFLFPSRPLDKRRIYYLEIPSQGMKSWCNFDGWFRETYSDKELGANIAENGNSTTFRIFAPRADSVVLYLYRLADDQNPYEVRPMKKDANGVWEVVEPANLKGIWYDFTVHGPEEKGNLFYESNPVHIGDPYARVTDDTWGKCRVWPKTVPAKPLKDGIPSLQEVIAYEVHVEDFTNRLPIADSLKGTLEGMVQKGLVNENGEPVGFDHLVNLGINVLHLMPIQEYLHYPNDTWAAAFKDDPYMREQGISETNYQWGYRTSYPFAVETRYRTPGTEPGTERGQFRDLVEAYHQAGIAVIIDIVPNHTAENMDARPHYFNYSVLDQLYYYRTRDLELIGEYGNEVKFENRPMVQRWLIDQCQHWIDEFGIDGFRIDLAGQVDEQTLIKLREALGPDIIVYGEPWIGSADPDYEENPDWDWYKVDAPITFFQDDARNAFKGPVSNPQDKKTDRGYSGGNVAERARVKMGLTCTFPEEDSPLDGINYLDIHDNWALADQFATTNWDGRKGVDETRVKIAATLLFTSLGPVVMHGGTEFLRSKGLAPLKEIVKTTTDGIKVYIHGKRDTYNLRAANEFVWENIGKTGEEAACDYQGMLEFWRGLIHFRRSPAGALFHQAKPVTENFYRFIEPENPELLGYFIADEILVLLNVGEDEERHLGVYLPHGNWKEIGNNEGFDHQNGAPAAGQLQTYAGDRTHDFVIPGPGLRVFLRGE